MGKSNDKDIPFMYFSEDPPKSNEDIAQLAQEREASRKSHKPSKTTVSNKLAKAKKRVS